MKLYRIIPFIILLLSAHVSEARENATLPLTDLIERIAPESSAKFIFKLEDQQSPNDYFVLSSSRKKIVIKGNSTLSIACGINYYLKNFLGITPTEYNLPLSLPKNLPLPEKSIRKETNILNRFHLERKSYTGARVYWGWDEWQREIDLIALNGATATYIPIGTEIVWHNVLSSFGLNDSEIEKIMPMPSYLMYWFNGMYDEGAKNLPEEWNTKQYELQKDILKELKRWNIAAIAEGYNGMPFNQNGIQTTSKQALNKAAYKDIATLYYNELHRLYGKFTYYSVLPYRTDEQSANNVTATEVFSEMRKANSLAIWVYDTDSGKITSSEMGSLSRGDALLVYTNQTAIKWDPTGESQHHDRIVKFEPMTPITYGNQLMNSGLQLTDLDPVGYVQGAINHYLWGQKETIYELNNFVKERYGKTNEQVEQALKVLLPVALEKNSRPAFYSVPSLSNTPSSILDYENYISALTLFIKEARVFASNSNYQHDLIFFTKEITYKKSEELLAKISQSVRTKNKSHFLSESKQFLNLILKTDELFATHDEYMFDSYKDIARAKGDTFEAKGIYEGDVRKYVTIWGSRYMANMQKMNDFSYQEKSGILSDYYYKRWVVYFNSLESIIDKQIQGDIDFYEIGQQWSIQRNTFEKYPQSSPILKAVELIRLISDVQ